jgi:four helix bundle protein
MVIRKNINRGYMKLTVWQDARRLYVITWNIFRNFNYELRKVASNQIASVDSVNRNIAEGYCRRTINEYLQFLNIALASLGESVSSMYTYLEAKQIKAEEFEEWDILAFKIENGMKKLIESLQNKRRDGTWEDSFILKESNEQYNLRTV